MTITALPLILFSLTWLTAVASPGPNFVLISATSTSASRKSALYMAFGIAVASAVWGVIGYTGVSLVIASHQWAYILIKLLGGLYLIWLGYKLVKSSFSPTTSSSPNAKAPLLSSMWAAIWTGFVTNMANPKTLVFVASLFAAFEQLMLHPQAYLSIPIMMLTSLGWHSTVATILSSKTMIKHNYRIRPWFNRGAGLMLLFYGLNFSVYDLLNEFVLC